MNKYILVLFLVVAGGVNAQKINWMSMNEALEAQKSEPKKIIMDVYTTWCGPCKLLDRNTFGNEDVINYINEHYYAVKFNAEGTEEININGVSYKNPNYQVGRKGRNAAHQYTEKLKIRGYPSLVFYADDGSVIEAIPGYKSPTQLEIYLKMIASDDYKDVDTVAEWQEYQQNFKGTFKG